MNKLLKETLLEALRVAVLAVLPVLLAYLQVISPEVAGVLVVVLKVLDKGLHKSVYTKGIVRF